jgi:hypothetical protein
VEGVSTLQNRFEETRKVTVKAGQFSTLDFKLLRVIPAVAKPISVASLRHKLSDLHLPFDAKSRAIAFAKQSREETFSPAPVQIPEVTQNVRANPKASDPKHSQYTAMVEDPADENQSVTPTERVLSHLVGDEQAGKPLLTAQGLIKSKKKKPGRSTASVGGVDRNGKSAQVSVTVEKSDEKAATGTGSPGESGAPGSNGENDSERQRLIEDLSKIRSD